MEHFRDADNRIIIEHNLPIHMRDGTILYSNVFRPLDEDKKYPVILNRTPYCKELFIWGTLDPITAARNGYAVVLQDVRGRFFSQGGFTPFVNEVEDGFDTIEYLSNAAWSNGRIGSFGLSYSAVTVWAEIASGHPGLKTAIIYFCTPDNYEIAYTNGVLNRGIVFSWALGLSINVMQRKEGKIPPDILKAANEIESMGIGMPGSEDLFRSPPDCIFNILKEYAPFYFDWISNQKPEDPYWENIIYKNLIDHISIPTMHIGGWYDIFTDGTIGGFNMARKKNDNYHKLIMGPWDHTMPHKNITGEINFGMEASEMVQQAFFRELNWYDRFLKDIDNKIDAQDSIDFFLMGKNKWVSFNQIPGKKDNLIFYLDRHQNLVEALPPQGKCTIIFDPRDPVPSIGGRIYWSPAGNPFNSGARDQQYIECRSDVAVFTSEELGSPIRILGKVKGVIYASTDANDMDMVLKLTDVYPDGRSINISENVLRGSLLEYLDQQRLEEGRIYIFDIDLDYIFIEIAAGHRLRLDISGSSFPSYDMVENIFEGNRACGTKRSSNTIYFGGDYASCIIIPLMEYDNCRELS